MPHLHINRHGLVTGRIHHHHHHRPHFRPVFCPRPFGYVAPAPFVAVHRPIATPVFVGTPTPRVWTRADTCCAVAASIAAITGVAIAILGILFLSPAAIIIGSLFAVGSAVCIPSRYYLV